MSEERRLARLLAARNLENLAARREAAEARARSAEASLAEAREAEREAERALASA